MSDKRTIWEILGVEPTAELLVKLAEDNVMLAGRSTYVHLAARDKLIASEKAGWRMVPILNLDNAMFDKARTAINFIPSDTPVVSELEESQQSLLDVINYATMLYLRLEEEKDNGPDERKS